MGSSIQLQETLHVGQAATYKSDSLKTAFAVVFEDDGDTGYFYALDTARTKQPILDALQIYNVAAVSDRSKPSTLQIVWSDDGLKAVVVINRHPHAVFDFHAQRDYCRTNFPPPSTAWMSYGHEWDDTVLQLFR